jgi:hypothetical protein
MYKSNLNLMMQTSLSSKKLFLFKKDHIGVKNLDVVILKLININIMAFKNLMFTKNIS